MVDNKSELSRSGGGGVKPAAQGTSAHDRERRRESVITTSKHHIGLHTKSPEGYILVEKVFALNLTSSSIEQALHLST